MGGGSPQEPKAEERDSRPVDYANDEEVPVIQYEEIANYQSVLEFASSGFLSAKSKGKQDGAATSSSEQAEKLRAKLRSAFLEPSVYVDAADPQERPTREAVDDAQFAERLKKINFVTKFSSEGVR
eukprot:gene9226-6632_t